MAHITIPEDDPIEYFTVGGTPTDTFAITFVIFEDDGSDVAVYNGDSLISPSDYTITPTAGTDGGYVGGSLVLDTAVTNTTITAIGNVEYKRITDFPTSGPFDITELNTELDKIVARSQQLRRDIGKSLRYSSTVTGITDTSIAAPVDNSVLAFDGTTGKIKALTLSSAAAATVAFPSSITDNALLKASGTNGLVYQSTGVIVDDSNNMTLSGLSFDGTNIKDTYKEDTAFTPAFQAIAAPTYTAQVGSYYQDGKIVTVYVEDITCSSLDTTDVSGIQINAPITGVADSPVYFVPSYDSTILSFSANDQIFARFNPGGTSIILIDAAGDNINYNSGKIGTNGKFSGIFQYIAS